MRISCRRGWIEARAVFAVMFGAAGSMSQHSLEVMR
jgi:hypothetical protein